MLNRKTKKTLEFLAPILNFKFVFSANPITTHLSFENIATLFRALNIFSQIRLFLNFNLSIFKKRFSEHTLIKDIPPLDFLDNVAPSYYKPRTKPDKNPFNNIRITTNAPQLITNEDYSMPLIKDEDAEVFKNSFLDLIPYPLKKKGLKYNPLTTTTNSNIPKSKDLKAKFNSKINQVAIAIQKETNVNNNFFFIKSISLGQHNFSSEATLRTLNSFYLLNYENNNILNVVSFLSHNLIFFNQKFLLIFNYINILLHLYRLSSFMILLHIKS